LSDENPMEDRQGTPVRGERVARARARTRRRWLALAAAGVVMIAAAGVLVAANGGGGSPAGSPVASVSTSPTVAPAGPPSNLLLFGVRTNPSLLALVGSGAGRPASALAIPAGLAAPSPIGLITVNGAVALPGAQFQTVSSNALGVWIPNWAVTDLGGIAAMAAAAHGIDVNMPDSLTFGKQIIGPGQAHLSGVQTAAYLNSAVDSDRLLRWQAVLEGLLASGVPLSSASGISTNDMSSSASVWSEAKGAGVDALPIPSVISGASVAPPIAVPQMIDQHFGTHAAQAIDVAIQDGSGKPDSSWTATTRMVKAGFKAVDYAASSSGVYGVTKILAMTQEALSQAKDLQQALHVGTVVYVTRTTNLADIQLLIGKDYK
jgi:hypothetical protein